MRWLDGITDSMHMSSLSRVDRLPRCLGDSGGKGSWLVSRFLVPASSTVCLAEHLSIDMLLTESENVRI